MLGCAPRRDPPFPETQHPRDAAAFPRVPSLEPRRACRKTRPGERDSPVTLTAFAARPTLVVFSDVFFPRAPDSTPPRPQASAASARRARRSPATTPVLRSARTTPRRAPSVAPSRARRPRKRFRKRPRRRAARRWSRPASGTKPRRSRRRRSGRFPRARGVGSRRSRAPKAAQKRE